jgi:signal transduction histidine kinase
MSGLQVLKQIKEIDPAVEVILLTGYETIEYVREAMRLGACEYITKPYIVDDLRASVPERDGPRQTSRKTAAYAQQLDQLQNEIHHQQMREELARTRNQIYASIIHDVTSPLTAIAGYCELMQHTVANAEMLEADQLSKVRKQAQLISRNVANCIDLSRRYLGFLEGSFSTKSQSSVNEVFYDLAELLEAYPKVRAKQLIIQPIPADRQVAMHRTDLLQVLLNLTINALQSAVEYHRVEVSARELETEGIQGYLQNGPGVHVLKSPGFNESVPLLAISVQDNGPAYPSICFRKSSNPISPQNRPAKAAASASPSSNASFSTRKAPSTSAPASAKAAPSPSVSRWNSKTERPKYFSRLGSLFSPANILRLAHIAKTFSVPCGLQFLHQRNQ